MAGTNIPWDFSGGRGDPELKDEDGAAEHDGWCDEDEGVSMGRMTDIVAYAHMSFLGELLSTDKVSSFGHSENTVGRISM